MYIENIKTKYQKHGVSELTSIHYVTIQVSAYKSK